MTSDPLSQERKASIGRARPSFGRSMTTQIPTDIFLNPSPKVEKPEQISEVHEENEVDFDSIG